MGFFDRFRRRNREIPGVTGASAQTLAELEQFLSSREGVEAYLEPPTTVYATTLCLVAVDGEFLRRPVKHERQARALCEEHRVPLYDARKVGYPRRMREYEKGRRQQRIGLEDLPPLDVTEEPDLDN
ncbi:MAG: oxidoreductase [Pseudonocardiaceae bacterium]